MRKSTSKKTGQVNKNRNMYVQIFVIYSSHGGRVGLGTAVNTTVGSTQTDRHTLPE